MSAASSSTPTASAPQPVLSGDADLHHRRRWWILTVLATAQLMMVLDATVVNIALPSAQRDLAFDDSGRQWVVTSYALAFGSLLLLGGRLADMLGRRRVFLVGLVGFAAASAIGGAAGNLSVLVAARSVQGVFGALLAPAALSLLSTSFVDVKERSKAFGIFGAIAGGGAAVGLLLGGLLTEYASWRWCMFINIFFAAAAFIGGLVFLSRYHDAREKGRLDVAGTVLGTSGLFSVVYGFAHAQDHGWSNTVTMGFIAAGVILLVGFVLVQMRVKNPLLPLRIVLDRNRGGSYFALLASGIGMFAVFLFLTYYMQEVLGMSPVKSGLAYLPLTAALVIVSQVGTNVLGPRVGERWIIAPGMALAAAGLWLLTRLGTSSSYATDVLPAVVIFGAGLGLVFASALDAATSGVRPEDSGIASALVNVGQQVGGSLGTALLSTLAASAATDYATSHTPGPRLALAASVHGYTVVFAWASLIFALGALITGVTLRGKVAIPNGDAVDIERIDNEEESSAEESSAEESSDVATP